MFLHILQNERSVLEGLEGRYIKCLGQAWASEGTCNIGGTHCYTTVPPTILETRCPGARLQCHAVA